MGDGFDILTQVATDVKYIRENLDEHKQAFAAHVKHDDDVSQNYLKPLWEESQQRKGAAKLGAVLYGGLSAIVALIVSWFASKHI